MWNAAFPCTDPFFKAMLQNSHDLRKKTVQILPPLSDIKSKVATGNTTDVAAMVVEG